jgi:hypothetical protein
MASLYVEEKIRERIRPAGLHLKRVTVLIAQKTFDRARGVVPGAGAAFDDYIARQCAYLRIEIRRQLLVSD